MITKPSGRPEGKARVRRRYIVFEVLTAAELKEDSVRRALESKFQEIFGSESLVLSSFKVIHYDSRLHRGIVRVKSKYTDHAMAVMGLVREIDGVGLLMYPIATSGTVRRAMRKLQKS